MDLEIEDRLQEIYKFIKIEVIFKDFCKYEITIKIEHQGTIHESKFIFTYDVTLTKDVNIARIVDIIDNKIIVPFYKKGD